MTGQEQGPGACWQAKRHTMIATGRGRIAVRRHARSTGRTAVRRQARSIGARLVGKLDVMHVMLLAQEKGFGPNMPNPRPT